MSWNPGHPLTYPSAAVSPAVSAQQIICSPGTHYLLRLFALLSSEAGVTPPIHTHIHTSPNTGNGYHSNQDPDLFAGFSSLTSKRPIHFSCGRNVLLWNPWSTLPNCGSCEVIKRSSSFLFLQMSMKQEHNTQSAGRNFISAWVISLVRRRGHWQIHSLHGSVRAFSKGCHELWMCCVWVPLLTSSFQNSHFSVAQNR